MQFCNKHDCRITVIYVNGEVLNVCPICIKEVSKKYNNNNILETRKRINPQACRITDLEQGGN